MNIYQEIYRQFKGMYSDFTQIYTNGSKDIETEATSAAVVILKLQIKRSKRASTLLRMQ